MKIVEIKNIKRKDVPIYYRRIYSGIVVYELLEKSMETPVDFQIEHKPTGETEIMISSMETADYPLIPLRKELMSIITELETTNRLPN